MTICILCRRLTAPHATHTTAWKPATYDHSKYFVLDNDHHTACSTCHTDPADFKKYTCYNCHEHSPSRIAEEHREEGIYNYQNCIKCHRNASEGEGEHEGGREREGGEMMISCSSPV